MTEGEVGRGQVRIVKPLSYMNRSGIVLRPLLDAGLDATTELMILVDDVDLPLGVFRLRGQGSAGGHKGLKSIAGALQSTEYARLRIGVGPVSVGIDTADFVLDRFSSAEAKSVPEGVPEMVEALDCWLREGIESTMNRFNRRGGRD